MKNTFYRPIGVDLFSGAGGLSLGFEQAGFDIAASVEVDPIHAAVHKFNFPECATLCKSITDVSGDEIRKEARLGNQPVDVVFGGPPCQGFSLIGKRALDDPRNALVRHFVRIVVELRARYFVFENVRGLTIGKHKEFLAETIKTLKAHGYSVVMPYRVLNARDFGVPQDRKRLFLIGCRDGEQLPEYPSSRKPTNVKEAIGDLPEIGSLSHLIERDSIQVKLGAPSEYALRLRNTASDPDDHSYSRFHDATLLTSSRRTLHSAASAERFLATPNGETEAVSRFHKLAWDGVCNTLRAGTDSARGAFTSPRPIHPKAGRVITVREAARLHSFPDWFRFHTTKWHGFRQIGNSVPPLLGRAVAAELIKAMRFRSRKPARKLPPQDETLLTMNMGEACTHFNLQCSPIAVRFRPEYEKSSATINEARKACA